MIGSGGHEDTITEKEERVAWSSSCSRNTHDRNVLVRRAQSRIDQATLENEVGNWDGAQSQKSGRGAARPSFLLAEAARSECAPSMRTVKDGLAAPLRASGGIGRASFDARIRGSIGLPSGEMGKRALEVERRDSWYGLRARRAPTIKQWSLDARSEGQSGHSLERW